MLTLPSSYQFTPKDLTGSALAWKRVRRQANGSQTAFSFLQETDFGVVPPDRVWLITHVTVQGTPGVGQNFLWASVTENEPTAVGGAAVGLPFHFTSNVGGASQGGDSRFASYLVQPNNHLRAFANFDAGGVSNLIIFDIAGWLVPRANIEFAGSK